MAARSRRPPGEAAPAASLHTMRCSEVMVAGEDAEVAPQSQQSCRLGREPSHRPHGGENAQ